MLFNLPIEILNLIIDLLNYKDIYNLLLINSYFNNKYGKDKFKEKYISNIHLEKYLNKDYNKFKNLIQYVNEDKLEEIFLLSLHDIKTVWINFMCGIYDMKYIFECMYYGCRINDTKKLQGQALHFYRFFYNHILRAIVEGDREKTQININNCKMVRSLHTDFKPFNK